MEDPKRVTYSYRHLIVEFPRVLGALELSGHMVTSGQDQESESNRIFRGKISVMPGPADITIAFRFTMSTISSTESQNLTLYYNSTNAANKV